MKNLLVCLLLHSTTLQISAPIPNYIPAASGFHAQYVPPTPLITPTPSSSQSVIPPIGHPTAPMDIVLPPNPPQRIFSSTTTKKSTSNVEAYRKSEPILVKRVTSSNEDSSISSKDYSGKDDPSSDEEDIGNKNSEHSNKGDPPGKQLNTGFGTPIIEEPYTKL